MTLLPAGTDNRRFFLSLGVALLAHLALGAALSIPPQEGAPREREYQLLQVTLTPGTTPGTEQARPEESGAAERAAPPPKPATAEVEEGPENSKTSSADEEVPREEPLEEAPPPTTATPLESLPEPTEPAGSSEESQKSVNTEAAGPAEATLPPRTASLLNTEAGSPSEGNGPVGNDLPTLEPTRYVAPEYPEPARQAGWTGTVTIELTIGRRGRVERMELIESSGHHPLDEAAMRAVRLWRFPRGDAGERSLHRFDFRLE